MIEHIKTFEIREGMNSTRVYIDGIEHKNNGVKDIDITLSEDKRRYVITLKLEGEVDHYYMVK